MLVQHRSLRVLGEPEWYRVRVRRETVGSGQSDSWNYKETITTNFDMETLQCRKCVRTQNCDRPYEPMFGKLYCKSWAEPVETCSTIQF